jgi:hypothetical protein
VRLWDLTAGPAYPSVELPQSDGTVSLAWTPDGRWLAVGRENGRAGLLSVPTPPMTTREMQLRTCVALGARESEGGYQTLTAGEWESLRHDLELQR